MVLGLPSVCSQTALRSLWDYVFLTTDEPVRPGSQCWSEDWQRLWWGVMVPGDAASPDVSFLFWVLNRN